LKTLKTLIIFTMFTTPVYAECVINGVIYPEGSIVSGHVCEEGEWVEEE